MTDAGEPIVVDFRKNGLAVPYLKAEILDIGIQNNYPATSLVVESLALKFQSRQEGPGGRRSELLIDSEGAPLSIGPGKRDYCRISVCPNLLFYKSSNYFNLAATYRLFPEERGRKRMLVKQMVGWINVVEAPNMFGKVFISYKEDEDRRLAERLRDFSRDSGFDPYMAPPDTKTGSKIWGEKISTAIMASKFMFVIWTRNAPKGSGVRREIQIARKGRIPVVPLLEQRASDPKLFGRDVEWTRFDTRDPDPTFSEVVAARREML